MKLMIDLKALNHHVRELALVNTKFSINVDLDAAIHVVELNESVPGFAWKVAIVNVAMLEIATMPVFRLNYVTQVNT